MELVPYCGIGLHPGATACWGEPVPTASELSPRASALSRRDTTESTALCAVCLGCDTRHEIALDRGVIHLYVEPREHGIEAELEAVHEHHALGQGHEIAPLLEHDLFHIADLDHQLADELTRDSKWRRKQRLEAAARIGNRQLFVQSAAGFHDHSNLVGEAS